MNQSASPIFSDYIVYVDESGDHSLESIDPEYPVFVLSFCIFRKDVYAETITPAVRKLKFHTFGHDMAVLHEIDIRKKRGAFSRLGKEDRLTYLVCEARGAREDAELELEFRRIRDGSNSFNKHLPFNLVIADKKTNSEGMQLADLTARPIGLSILRPGQKNRAMIVLEEKFCQDETGEKEGVGLKIFP